MYDCVPHHFETNIYLLCLSANKNLTLFYYLSMLYEVIFWKQPNLYVLILNELTLFIQWLFSPFTFFVYIIVFYPCLSGNKHIYLEFL